MEYREDAETTERLELRALERMIAALCDHIDRVTCEARSRGALCSREADFQLQVFEERREQARETIEASANEPYRTRVGRLEHLVEALDCSRDYFRAFELETA